MNMKEMITQPHQRETLMTQLDHTMGHIRGKIADINGKPIPGSKIWITGTGQSTLADENGNFVIINIVPGLHTIAVERLGYSLCVSPDMPVEVGDNPGFCFVMHSFPIPERLYNAGVPGRFALQF